MARGAGGLAGAMGCSHCLRLAFSLRSRLYHTALALDRCQGFAVETVDVVAELQLAGIVDESGLIGEMDPDRRRLQLKLLLGSAVHGLNLFRRPVLAWPCDVE